MKNTSRSWLWVIACFITVNIVIFVIRAAIGQKDSDGVMDYAVLFFTALLILGVRYFMQQKKKAIDAT
jgi:hypothetical protein